MRLLFATIISFLFFNCGFSQSCQVKGKVQSGESKEKLSGAFVTCTDSHGKTTNTLTDFDGEFKIRNLAPGEYEVKVDYVGYDVFDTHITLKDNDRSEIKVTLSTASKSLSGVEVFGHISQQEEAGARQKEQRANNIVNAISAQAMQRSPDINAANVLQRMSGLTIERNGGGDEAYPVIRGLDPRYSNTLIDGIKIASPDDKSRFVSLSIVPSELLGSIEVHKTLTPDMEADAIGGTVNMVMKDAPLKKIFHVLGSLGYSKLFFDRKFEKFSTADIQQKSLIEKYGSSYTAKPEDFPRTNLDFKPTTPLPTAVASLTLGNRFFHNKLGVLFAGTFQNQYYGSNSVYNQAAINIHTAQPTYSDYAVREFSTQQLNNGAVLHLDYVFNDKNKITLTNTLLYSYLEQSRTIIDTAILGGNGGRTVPGTGPVSTDYFSITSKQLIENLKLEGKHLITKDLLFDWTGVFSYAKKRSPDFADISVNKKIDTVHTTNDIHGPYNFVTTPDYFDVINRTWQHNEDKDLDGIANLTYRIKLSNHGNLELKGGGLYRHKTRYNIQDKYQLLPTTSSSGTKQIYTNIYDAQWTVYNSHGTFDYDKNNYQLFENITAFYGQFKLIFPSFDVVGGIRDEHTSQGYTLNTFYPAQINGVTKTYTDVLPSANLRIILNSRMNLRAGYYKSIARPNYYDLVPVNTPSVSSATSTSGNPDLKHSVADNYDLRYEFYPKGEQQLFVGVFYKNIKDPIESASSDGTTFKPANFGTAKVYGFELQFTKYIGKFGVTGNYTYLHSEISAPKSYFDLSQGTYTTDSLEKRPLQGQTNHTANFSLLYKNESRAIFVQLAYEYIGRTLAQVYPLYGYDYYADPQSLLALSAEKSLHNRHFTLFGKCNNMLNTHTKSEINHLLMINEVTKFSFSLGVRYSN